jgi:putative hemolysin
VVVAITYFSIVPGRARAQAAGQLDPEAVARRVARPMELLARIMRPFVALLAGSTRLVAARARASRTPERAP